MSDTGSALIVGAGPALGGALGRRFAAAGLNVALAARSAPERAAEMGLANVHGYAVDARDEAQIIELFERVESELGPLRMAIHNAGVWQNQPITEMSAEIYEKVWRLACFAGFLVGREAARRMVPRGEGSIFFTGATASVRGAAGFAAFSGGKFGLRALAQSLARELGPKGIHVAHVIVDGMIDAEAVRARFADRIDELPADALLDPDAIAETYYALHAQHRSAWSHEVDVRPWTEKF
jgi:NAD(P)-dependent dehydrogenase (short-subunit alcohol dehydrogenase family)